MVRILMALAVVGAGGLLSGDQTNAVMRAERPYVQPAGAASVVVVVDGKVKPAIPVKVVVPETLASKLSKATAVEIPGIVKSALSSASSSEIPGILREALAKVLDDDIPAIAEVALDNALKDDIPAILEILLSRATEAESSELAATVYSKLVTVVVPGMQPAQVSALKTKWYEIFQAAGGTRMYWILKLARERAAKGENVDNLKKAFDTSMMRWLTQDEDEFEFLYPTEKDPE